MDVGFLQLCCRFSNVIPFTKIKQLLFLSLSLLSALKFPWGRENWTRDRKPGYNCHIQPDLVGIPWSRPFLSLGFEFCICINMKSASKVQGFQDRLPKWEALHVCSLSGVLLPTLSDTAFVSNSHLFFQLPMKLPE